MIGNIKEILPPKTGIGEKQLLQDPGYVEGVGVSCIHQSLSRPRPFLKADNHPD